MKARLIPFEVAPGSLKPMVELEKVLKSSGPALKLIELVKSAIPKSCGTYSMERIKWAPVLCGKMR